MKLSKCKQIFENSFFLFYYLLLTDLPASSCACFCIWTKRLCMIWAGDSLLLGFFGIFLVTWKWYLSYSQRQHPPPTIIFTGYWQPHTSSQCILLLCILIQGIKSVAWNASKKKLTYTPLCFLCEQSSSSLVFACFHSGLHHLISKNV